jgi:hypothetical protein
MGKDARGFFPARMDVGPYTPAQSRWGNESQQLLTEPLSLGSNLNPRAQPPLAR